MQGLAITFGVVCIVVWLYLLVGRGGFWRIDRLRAEPAFSMVSNARIAVVIPARNEAESIGDAIRSLLAQTGCELLRVFVVDDHSDDGTADVAREAAASAAASERLTVITGAALPPGWTGKLWAVHQGVEQARLEQPRYLLLTDADIRHGPGSIATLLNVAERGRYDLTSFMVKLHCRSLPERLLIPAFVFFFFLLYPPEWIRDPRRKVAGAAGGCMLVRPEALARGGGVQAIRSEVIDDCALARCIKRTGGRVWLGVTADSVSLREYDCFGEIAQMIARTAFNQLRHSPALLAEALAGLVVTYLSPVLLLFTGWPVAMLLGATGYLLMGLSYVPMVRFYMLNPLWALTLPFAAAFYMASTVRSAINYWSGRGGEWKGRAQDIPRAD
jgi:hopene-associated glycosyltransferase HpnB